MILFVLDKHEYSEIIRINGKKRKFCKTNFLHPKAKSDVKNNIKRTKQNLNSINSDSFFKDVSFVSILKTYYLMLSTWLTPTLSAFSTPLQR